jgi:hypothetical protein
MIGTRRWIGLEPLPQGNAYEVCLIENGLGLPGTVAVGLAADGDRTLKLGVLPPSGSFLAGCHAFPHNPHISRTELPSSFDILSPLNPWDVIRRSTMLFALHDVCLFSFWL